MFSPLPELFIRTKRYLRHIPFYQLRQLLSGAFHSKNQNKNIKINKYVPEIFRYSKIIIVYQSKLSAFLHLLLVMLLIYCGEDDILCHTDSIILKIPSPPFPFFCPVVFRYGIFDFSETIVMMLIKFSGNAAQRETVAIVCPYGIGLVSADFCLGSLGNGSFPQRGVGFSCGVIDIDSQITAIFSFNKCFR